MNTLNYKELKRQFELDGAARTVNHLSEALNEGQLAPEDFSIRDLAETVVENGSEWVRSLDPRNNSSAVVSESDGVDLTAFLNISGQIIFTKIRQAYENEAFVLSKAVSTIPTRFSGEKIPGIGRLGDEAMEVAPGMPYPNAGLSEEYTETPETVKRGLIVPITREAIFFDRTNLILRRAEEAGEALGLNKEKRILDCVLGVTNTYKFNGSSYNTYYSAGGSPWINALASNELVDYKNVDKAEQLFADMLDPSTGEPILIQPKSVLVMPAYRFAAAKTFLDGDVTFNLSTSQSIKTRNPLRHYDVMESALAYRRLVASGVSSTDAKKYWYLGDFKKAFAYMENWPISVTRSVVNSDANFERDILVRYKASERGVPAVLDPRYVVKCTG